MIKKENIISLLNTPYINVYDLQYAEGKHYYNASRKPIKDLVAIATDAEFKKKLPDAVSCFVIIECPDKEPLLLTFYEYRYPTGQYLLSIPAGLIDEKDKAEDNPIFSAAIREIKEETGMPFGDNDTIEMVSPVSFSSPGMTDESNALICAVLHPDDLSSLSQEGAEGSELFAGFEILTKADAMSILRNGAKDKYGNSFSLMTWSALMYFATDMWKH